MDGCQLVAWILVLIAVALLALLFAMSWVAGLVGLAFVLGILGLLCLAVFLLDRFPRRCPVCHRRKLQRVPVDPMWNGYRCEECGAEFAEFSGRPPGLIGRSESPVRDAPGWDAG